MSEIFNEIFSGVGSASGLTPAQSEMLTNKNYLVNGAFQVAQRGTTIVYNGSGNNGFLDRWFGQRSSGATGMTVAQQYDSTNRRNICKIQRDASNTGTQDLMISQAVSSEMVQNVLAGNTVTLSGFFNLGTNYSSASGLSIRIYSGTVAEDTVTPTGFATGNTLLGSTTTSLTLSTWLSFKLTVSVPTNAKSLVVSFIEQSPQGTAGANDSFSLARVKLELGSFATKFTVNTVEEELYKCLPYYERISASISNAPTGTIGFADGTSTLRAPVVYFKKRKTPTVSISSQTGLNILRWGTDTTSTAISFATTTLINTRMDITTAGAMTGGEACIPNFTNSTQYIEINAENF